MKTVNGLQQELDSDSEYSMGTSGVRVRGRADVIVRAWYSASDSVLATVLVHARNVCESPPPPSAPLRARTVLPTRAK